MNNQSNEGTSRKRKNRRSSEGVPNKRSRRSTEKPKKPAKPENPPPKKPKKKKKRTSRRKTTGMRKKLCEIFEKALTDSPTLPPIYHLFNSLDPSGTPRASLIELIRTLQVSKTVKNIHYLSQDAWKAMTNLTHLFAIEEDDPSRGLFLKFRPIYNPKKCTVYVDNLPDGCKKEKLERLASCYGNVSEVKVCLKRPNIVKPANAKKEINVGSREKSFGFVRFVDEESAISMIEKFHLNDPTKICAGGIRRRGFYELYAMKLLREIRFLRLRRRRRKLTQVFRLMRLRAKLQALYNLDLYCRKAKYRNGRRNTWRRNFHNNHRDSKYLPDPTPSTSTAPSQRRSSGVVSCPSPPSMSPQPSTSKTKHTPKKKHPERKKNGGSTTKKNGTGSKKKPKKKKRKLRYGSRKALKYIPGRSVHQYFERVQVLSMEQYEELKEEYLQLIADEKTKQENQ